MSGERGAPVLLAVDFTADTLRLLMAAEDGAPLQRERWPLPDLPDEEAWAWEVGGRIATLFAREGARRSARAIVVAAPGHVDPVAGRLIESHGQPAWDDLAIVEALRRHIGAPIAVEQRTLLALQGERWQGAAAGADDALYVSLHGVPAAAAVVGRLPLRGAHLRAGALPALPEIDGRPPTADLFDEIAGLLAGVAALLDPEVVVLDAPPPLLARLTRALQRVLDDVAPGPRVVAATLGEDAALLGALRMAQTLRFEAEHGA